MPELPEVETVCRDLIKANIIGKTITNTHVRWPNILHQTDSKSFKKNCLQAKIKAVKRRGKYIILELSNDIFLLIHLRMTGKLRFEKKLKGLNTHDHMALELNDQSLLVYNDTRKFGRWYQTNQLDNIIGHLGPEPLEEKFTTKYLLQITKSSKAKIKPFLLDQTNIAGIGNIYADECLFKSKIHPESICEKLPENAIKELWKNIRFVLKKGIKNNGTSLGNASTNFYSIANKKGNNKEKLFVFRRENEPCPNCQNIIKKIVVAQRGTHICPNCQVLLK